ncbi:hypothetical protein M413DRAFT_438021 [Hebeloma cylindrosporum]|uniref:Uncharacterized protein n=1 Tax=Hebeloma cylindrosporum TaxID=76867 RepID=A0A0C3CYC7_HEBCY|nr:hypothetical protein M413DRAFT_438021 [Hebeloma cylindrosporum h7]
MKPRLDVQVEIHRYLNPLIMSPRASEVYCQISCPILRPQPRPGCTHRDSQTSDSEIHIHQSKLEESYPWTLSLITRGVEVMGCTEGENDGGSGGSS